MIECVKMYLILLLCACAIARAQEGPAVNTTQGVVIGRLVGNYLEFHGIPYAGPVSGENRFKAPTSAPIFSGEFHAIEDDVICAHPSSGGLVGIENCLRLSIITKNITTPKPVLVWIQGEEYTTWNSKPYSYNAFVESDLVFVKINYRLSIFGFLCLGVADAPGNAGLKDVVQGLKWIQDNIAGFGGDPNNVVLMGHGSGAAMVDLITLSPLATGLAHKAIALSGSALAPWAIAYDQVGHAKAVGNTLGYADKDREELAKLLVTTDINVLEVALRDFAFPNNSILFQPCIENIELNPNDTFLADAPINILRSGNYSDIPYIAGHTDREGTIRAEQAAFGNWLDRMQANFSEFIQVDLNLDKDSNKTEIVQSIREFYFSQWQINMGMIEDYLDYHGDTMILVPVIRNVRERTLTSKSEVRLFEFAYRGTYNSDWPYTQIPLNGAKHGVILNYIFDYDLKMPDVMARDILVQRFAAFAYTGNPNGNDTTTWFPMNEAVPYLLYISGGEVLPNVTSFKEELRAGLNQQEMDFWDPLYEKYYVPPKAISSAVKLAYLSAMIVFSQFILRLL